MEHPASKAQPPEILGCFPEPSPVDVSSQVDESSISREQESPIGDISSSPDLWEYLDSEVKVPPLADGCKEDNKEEPVEASNLLNNISGSLVDADGNNASKSLPESVAAADTEDDSDISETLVEHGDNIEDIPMSLDEVHGHYASSPTGALDVGIGDCESQTDIAESFALVEVPDRPHSTQESPIDSDDSEGLESIPESLLENSEVLEYISRAIEGFEKELQVAFSQSSSILDLDDKQETKQANMKESETNTTKAKVPETCNKGQPYACADRKSTMAGKLSTCLRLVVFGLYESLLICAWLKTTG